MMNCLREVKEGVILSVRVIPRARETCVDGMRGDALSVRLHAPPVDGKANRALLRFLAETLALPAGSLVLVRGKSARNKRLLIPGYSVAAIRTRLQSLLPPPR